MPWGLLRGSGPHFLLLSVKGPKILGRHIMDRLEDLSRDELISRVLGLSQEVTGLNQKLQDMDVKLKEQILTARQMSVEQV